VYGGPYPFGGKERFMKHKVRNWFCFVFCLLITAPLLAQEVGLKKENATITTQARPSEFKEGLKELATTWWLWGGIVAIVGLVGLLMYLKKKQEED
jgi:LPXTG-motif cell wall-anchored protein